MVSATVRGHKVAPPIFASTMTCEGLTVDGVVVILTGREGGLFDDGFAIWLGKLGLANQAWQRGFANGLGKRARRLVAIL